ncbi:sigma-54 interaction domain-containing protein [Desulfitobacterium chlororespirans]|uniref:Transcriptional regulator containing PAS, AAA-type ATPase, and DNA-binding Fis domains n=1 Tax=Desulfitobacterium chlororespirans DSM 11544 TaxID=1121395 RepID=A0A1M7TWK6_9FIRM|nr:sigma 54-interacting transcriptional regulator [Desulfitobacterium chlororespirans]SHN75085.1 Transcriptional regulator containing PAS, AAA-type ATPase, and DNA-binding Fis domains [Desulfitobacterium chlororespirans DSM 11544]
MLKQEWDGILAEKELYLKGEWKDLTEFRFIRQEVIVSWEKAKKYNISEDMTTKRKVAKPDLLDQISQKYSFLIELTSSILNIFYSFVRADFAFYLCDTSSVVLLQGGDLIEQTTKTDQIVGFIMDEESVGTSSHLLCMEQQKPVQLIGPEHYCQDFWNIVGSSAPIFDQNNQLIGALVLIQPMPNEPWQKQMEDFFAYTLGFLTTMSSVINLQLKLSSKNEHLKAINRSLIESHKNLKTMGDTLNTTLTLMDYGVVTINYEGKIIHANEKAYDILRLNSNHEHKIADFFGGYPDFIEDVKSGQKTEIEDNFVVNFYGKKFIVTANPIINQETGAMEVAVLSFLNDQSISTVAHNRSGSYAQFSFDGIIGNSIVIKEAIRKAKQYAASPENILLLGESGTGKELFAQAIHNSNDEQQPFIAVNCAAIPRSLIESELFGYEGGTFTGAERKGRPGKIELSNGGTLFLDEIGDMPLELQAVLLRTLQDKKIMRVGGNKYLEISFRLIASTNRDLYQMVNDGLFRPDLYYRLSVLTVRIPPLRERFGDVDLLTDYCIDSYCKKVGMPRPEISAQVRSMLNKYYWPGNVRQLENAIIYGINTAKGNTILPQDLPWEIQTESYNPLPEKHKEQGDTVLSMSELERRSMLMALAKTNNNAIKAAEILGMGKSTFYRKLKRYEIEI